MDEQTELQQNAPEIENVPAPTETPPPEKQYSPEELAEIEAEMDKRRALVDLMKTHVLNQLEEEASDSRFGELMRSKNFWYCVFGLVFFLWMGALILWVAHDLAK